MARRNPSIWTATSEASSTSVDGDPMKSHGEVPDVIMESMYQWIIGKRSSLAASTIFERARKGVADRFRVGWVVVEMY